MVIIMLNKQPPYYAFFDVDGTLLKGKPMLDFLQYYYSKRFSKLKILGNIYYRLFTLKTTLLLALGKNREDLNKIYYRCYKGQDINWIKEIGRNWFSQMLNDRPNFYIQNIINELVNHQINGAEVVLVSGSFFACLEPFAQRFGIKHIISSTLEIKNNKCSGEILSPQIIGNGKKTAIRNFLGQRNFHDYQNCYAYGDHSSDLPMLSLVGNPKVIGGDSWMEEHARRKGWQVIQPT